MPVVVFPFIYFLKCISGLSPAMGRRLHLKNSKFPVINSEKRRNSISFAREENKIIHCSWSHGWGPGLRMRRFGFYFCLSLIEGESTNCSGWETQLMEFSRRDLDPIWNLQPFNNKTSSFFFFQRAPGPSPHSCQIFCNSCTKNILVLIVQSCFCKHLMQLLWEFCSHCQ